MSRFRGKSGPRWALRDMAPRVKEDPRRPSDIALPRRREASAETGGFLELFLSY
jgi:hypothetical protein